MARVHPLQQAFTGGELSPLMAVQTSFSKYPPGCRTLQNFLPLPQGPARRRPGTQYLGRYRDETRSIRLLPFVVADDEAFVIEVGDLGSRIWTQAGTLVTNTSELITNGTFDTGITGWTPTEGTPTWHAGLQAMQLTSGPGLPQSAEQAFAVTPGQPHTLRFQSGPDGFSVRIGTTSGGTDILPATLYFAGSHTVEFTPGVSPVYLRFRQAAGTQTTFVDNVSCTLAGAGIVSITTPYVEAHLPLLQWAQSIDVLYVSCPHHPFGKVRRFSTLDWDWTAVAFTVPPTAQLGRATAATLTPAATTGYGVTFTASASVFVASDVGRQIVAKPGRAVILTQAGTSCTADITEAFRSTAAIPAADWFLDVSPQTTLTPSGGTTVGAASTLTLSAAGWFAADVGKWVYLNSGVVEITAFSSATVVTGRVRIELASLTAAPAGAWSLEEPVYSDARGHLVAPTFHEGRLHVAHGFTDYGSRSDDYENFARGAIADAALVHPLTAGQINTITALISGSRDLLAGTEGVGFRLSGNGGPLTPDNPPDVKRAWKESTALAQPLVIDPVAIVPEAGGRKLLGISFNFDRDAYEAPDLAILAEHLTAQGLVEVVFTARPTPVLWARDAVGGLFAAAYLPEQSILAWSRQPIGGSGVVEALCAVPKGSGGADVLFLGVRRTVAGATVRSIERLDLTADVFVDAYVQVTGTDLTSVSGLGHIEGFTAQIRGDGATLPSQVVTGGAVSLPTDQASDTVQVGLFYDNAVVPMPPAEGNPAGTALGRLKRFSEYVVFVDQTQGLEVNGHTVPVRSPDDLLGVPPALQSGQVVVVNPSGWTREGLTTLRQPEPQPCTILGLGGVLAVEGG